MRTNEDEIVPFTEEGRKEEEEDGDGNGGDGNRSTPDQISTESIEDRRPKRSFRRGFSKFLATKSRRKKKKKPSDDASDSVSSPSQISCCLMPPCFNRPQLLAPDSPLSDTAFQSLIEKNDFYSAECNVHQNLSFSTRSHGN